MVNNTGYFAGSQGTSGSNMTLSERTKYVSISLYTFVEYACFCSSCS